MDVPIYFRIHRWKLNWTNDTIWFDITSYQTKFRCLVTKAIFKGEHDSKLRRDDFKLKKKGFARWKISESHL